MFKIYRSLTNPVVDLISKIFLTVDEQTLFVNRKADGWQKNLELKRLFHGICQRTKFIRTESQYLSMLLTKLSPWNYLSNKKLK